jgi:hypothetical protein
LQAQTVQKCWDEISPHVLTGGKTGGGVLASNSGGHLASSFFKIGVNQDAIKTAADLDGRLDIAHGLVQMTTTVRCARAPPWYCRWPRDAQKGPKSLFLDANFFTGNMGPQATPKYQLIKTKLEAFKGEPYTSASVGTMCMTAMAMSIQGSGGYLKTGTFDVKAKNLNNAIVPIVLHGDTRVTTCYPVVDTSSVAPQPVVPQPVVPKPVVPKPVVPKPVVPKPVVPKPVKTALAKPAPAKVAPANTA